MVVKALGRLKSLLLVVQGEGCMGVRDGEIGKSRKNPIQPYDFIKLLYIIKISLVT